jgi:hypothetical protein
MEPALPNQEQGTLHPKILHLLNQEPLAVCIMAITATIAPATRKMTPGSQR